MYVIKEILLHNKKGAEKYQQPVKRLIMMDDSIYFPLKFYFPQFVFLISFCKTKIFPVSISLNYPLHIYQQFFLFKIAIKCIYYLNFLNSQHRITVHSGFHKCCEQERMNFSTLNITIDYSKCTFWSISIFVNSFFSKCRVFVSNI